MTSVRRRLLLSLDAGSPELNPDRDGGGFADIPGVETHQRLTAVVKRLAGVRQSGAVGFLRVCEHETQFFQKVVRSFTGTSKYLSRVKGRGSGSKLSCAKIVRQSYPRATRPNVSYLHAAINVIRELARTGQ